MADNSRICPAGPGGNKQLVNQDEQKIHDRTETAAMSRVRVAGAEDDSHTTGVYRRRSFGGS